MPHFEARRIPGTPHLVLAGDGAITRHCLSAGRLDWDRSILEVPEVASRLVPGAVVIDAGAYIGDTTHLFLSRGCTVFAVEPQPDAFAVLEANCPGAVCIRRPLGLYRQRVTLTANVSNTYADNLGARQVMDDPGGVEVLALDALNPHRCDVLKVDCEGFEPFVLAGGEEFITRTRPVIYVEINQPALRSHGFTDHRDVYEMLERWGYKLSVPRWSERVGTDEPWDVLAVPA
jgi:FkbM family methyltransferase